MKKDNVNNKVAVSPSTAMKCSADGHQGNAERITPEQRADAIIQVFYADTPPPLRFELRDSIAAEIREAVNAEKKICVAIARNYHNTPCDDDADKRIVICAALEISERIGCHS